MLKDADVLAIATEIFAEALGPGRFERLEVRTGRDHDGDPSFFVTLYFKPGVDPRDVAAPSTAQVTLMRRLLDLDEERFPYLRYRYAGDEVLTNEDVLEAP